MKKLKNKNKIRSILLNWWKNNKREFPWRNNDSPYKICIAEIMLQQTNAERVESIYLDFIKEFPDLEEIYKVDIREIKKIIQPLGLIKRADYIKSTVDIIMNKYNGKFPNEKNKLLELPGIGDYVADAILCFGFNNPIGLMDTNTTRVISRIFNISSNKSRKLYDEKIYKKINEFVGKRQYKEINYSLLDFGAIICKSRNPLCKSCVLNGYCIYYNEKST